MKLFNFFNPFKRKKVGYKFSTRLNTHIPKVLFHGGCHRCTMQDKNGLDYCTGCKFFEHDWNLPDLNDSHILEEQHMNSIRKHAKELKAKQN